MLTPGDRRRIDRLIERCKGVRRAIDERRQAERLNAARRRLQARTPAVVDEASEPERGTGVLR